MAQSLDLFQNFNNKNPNGTPKNTQYVDGRLKAIFFSSTDSFYKVVLIEIMDTNIDWNEDEIVVTGNFGDLIEENTYHFIGKLIDHPKYGKQFQADNYSNIVATSTEGVVKYLAGEKFPGIGEKTAQRIVDSLGDNAIQQINDNHAVVKRLGLTKKQQDTLIDNIALNDDLEQVIIGLNNYGFSSQIASAIYSKYQSDSLKIIHDNPYQLAEDIDGVSFKKADTIAQANGMAFDSQQRIEAAIMYSLDQLAARNGDTYTNTSDLLEESQKWLNQEGNPQISGDKMAAALIELAKQKRVIGQKDRVYLARLYNAEVQIAEHINRIIKNSADNDFSDEQIKKQIRIVERQFQINYDESQESAIMQAIKSPMFILTGGPGTGKTTIINGIVNTFARLNELSLDVNSYKDKPFPVVLAAPTGRAAKHMADSTNLPASTIHRLLGLTRGDASDYSAAKDIDGAILVIDETSMVDTYLFRTLVRAVPNNMKVILVGDQDQLPSVGPGQVFHDLLKSRQIPAIELDTIYRQEKGSTITSLAHSIHNGELPKDFTENRPDRSFIGCSERQVASVVEQVAKRAKQKGFDQMSVQVLAPMYHGTAGVDHLNDVIQGVWQVEDGDQIKKKVEIRGHSYQIGDKVLQLINNPEQNVFNGDLGVIVSMKQEKGQDVPQSITIDFDANEVTYEKNEWTQFTLAYCTSIHKSQGSEFPMVILPIVHQFYRMLQRNLLYTAVTRASDFLILVGEKSAFEQCVRTVSVNRHTSLVEKLIETVNLVPVKQKVSTDQKDPVDNSGIDNSQESGALKPEIPNLLTKKAIEDNSIDPMIGMQGVSPKDFM